jgi:Flp pilus assembly protein TadB
VKLLRWDAGARSVPRRPYRDTALVYLALAAVVVAFAAVTGGSVLRALVIAACFWVVATVYGMLRWRRRLSEDRRREEGGA